MPKKREKEMNYKTPKSYVTPREFVDIVLRVCSELEYFNIDDKMHPEDIQINMEIVSRAVAEGMTYVIRKVADEQRNSL